MSDTPNVITPRRLALLHVRRLRQQAETDLELVEEFGDDWVFLKRLAEILESAVEHIESIAEPPGA